jgi:hypothetical protein
MLGLESVLAFAKTAAKQSGKVQALYRSNKGFYAFGYYGCLPQLRQLYPDSSFKYIGVVDVEGNVEYADSFEK